VQLIAGVVPLDNVAEGLLRLARIALGQQIAAFVLAAYMAHRGRVPLRKTEMPYRPKTGGAEGIHEAVGMEPAVETEAVTVSLEDAVHLGEGGFSGAGRRGHYGSARRGHGAIGGWQ
jgi:hypothetical protein